MSHRPSEPGGHLTPFPGVSCLPAGPADPRTEDRADASGYCSTPSCVSRKA
ncbi:hypothetical protein DB31_2293 [Hyalangium minutum]|uniref:Uncharacterized protein n=1 Tax=Hyalangium minutum TaxID=394096 RepID=A0A085W868_9BACT|nr:hypothetical protein DB31_2293 [Hyalangium minutum]